MEGRGGRGSQGRSGGGGRGGGEGGYALVGMDQKAVCFPVKGGVWQSG